MKNLFVDYETSKMLRELGFKENCLRWFHNEYHEATSDYIFLQYEQDEHFCYAPIWQQAKEWLWEKHKIRIDVLSHGVFPDCDFLSTILLKEETLVQTVFQTPIEAEIEGIKMA